MFHSMAGTSAQMQMEDRQEHPADALISEDDRFPHPQNSALRLQTLNRSGKCPTPPPSTLRMERPESAVKFMPMTGLPGFKDQAMFRDAPYPQGNHGWLTNKDSRCDRACEPQLHNSCR